MSWIAVAIIVFLFIVNNLVMFHKRVHTVMINDPMLAQDPEFIDDLSDAIARSLQRQMNQRAKLFEGLGE